MALGKGLNRKEELPNFNKSTVFEASREGVAGCQLIHELKRSLLSDSKYALFCVTLSLFF